MDYKDILKLDDTIALEELGRETPTHITYDIGYAKRQYAATHMEPIRVVRDSAGEEASVDGPWRVDDVDFRMIVGYQSGSGNISTMLLDGIYIDRDEMPLLTEYETFAACGDCKGSSGGCPAFAPQFAKMKRNVKELFVFIVHYDFIWAHEYVTKRGWGKMPVLRQMTYMDRLTDSYLNRLRKHMQKEIGCYILGVGNCLGCQPSKCTVIQGLPCKHPERRTFSMEATGIDCDELHHMIYGEYLPWYYKGTNMMPTYMSRYMCVYKEQDIDYAQLLKEAAGHDKYYVDPDLVPIPGSAYRFLQEVPSGCHKGYKQFVYDFTS